MKLLCIAFIVILLVFPEMAFSESDRYASPLSLQLLPGVDLPLGEGTTYFKPGVITGMKLNFTTKSMGIFNGSVGFDYMNNARTEIEDQFLKRFTLTAGGGLSLPLFKRVSLRAQAEGGYSFCTMDHDDGRINAGSSVVSLSLGPSFEFLPWLNMDLRAAYTGYPGLSQSVSISAGVTYRFKERKTIAGPPVLKGIPPKLIELKFDEIFPVFYSYYDTHPAGSAILVNPREDEITDIKVEFFVNQYMDTPRRCNAPDSLGPGKSGPVDIIALFKNSVLSITEGTKVAAELSLSYKIDGVGYTDTYSETMRLQYRNAMTWDDDRRAAAFVTAKDPAIMSFAKNVVSMLHGKKSSAINNNIQLAMAIHDALSLYGMSYVIDPTTSYAELSETETVIDFLQFPRETLEYKAGDCDDLSILYCALFESLGMETAFVTVPGHIFIAFSPGISPEEALRTFDGGDSLIIQEKKVWIPLEATALQESFLEAWDLGARQWRDYEAEGRVGFFPIRSAWEHYEPVGLPGEPAPIAMPLPAKVVDRFNSDIEEFTSRQMSPQEQKLKEEIREKKGNYRSYNKLGVLYARYGKLDEAALQFEKALQKGEYTSVLINIGNVKFLQEEVEKALEYYRRAEKLQPENIKVLLSLARTEYATGNRTAALIYYEKLKARKPDLASRLAYLDTGREETGRAAETDRIENTIIWDEEGKE